MGRGQVVEVTRTPIMSSKPRCIVCKGELDIDEAQHLPSDNIWYCDECFETIAREWEDEYDQE